MASLVGDVTDFGFQHCYFTSAAILTVPTRASCAANSLTLGVLVPQGKYFFPLMLFRTSVPTGAWALFRRALFP